MAHLQTFCYKGFGENMKKDLWYSQAVRIADRIEISGQGGWVCETSKIHEDMDEEVDQAFANVDHCLKDAGGKGWCQVYRVNLYVTVINDQMMGALVRNLKKWMPDHQPIMTAVGVAQLGLPGMRVEVEVVAHDPEGAAEIEAKKAAEKKE